MTNRPPRMDALLAHPEALKLARSYGSPQVKQALRWALDAARPKWRQGGDAPSAEALLKEAGETLAGTFQKPLRRVVNATGVVLHTNLGRAPLSESTLKEASRVLSRYVDLEVDLQARRRGHRDLRLEASVRDLFKTDRALVVVNNNAAATLLLLNTLSKNRETLVSRGELVEIGGGFRVPEVMAASGARLREVGTTNRTRLSDFRSAAGPDAALLLKVHPSNYRVMGFAEEVGLKDLVQLGRELGLPVAMDLGSGLAVGRERAGLQDEPTIPEALEAGPEALCFSADKLFGACQAGLLLVSPSRAEAFRSNPLLRALRVDKVTYYLLGAALDAYRRGSLEEIPALQMLGATPARLRTRAVRIKKRVEALCPGRFDLRVVEMEGRAGGGTAPLTPLPSPALSVRPSVGSSQSLEEFFRIGEPPVLSVMADDRVVLHMRTLLKGDGAVLIERMTDFGKEPRP